MKNYLFAALLYLLLLFLLMCGTLCGNVCAESITPSPNSGNGFKIFETVEITNELKTTAQNVEIKDFYSPVLVSANNVFVALAGINCKSPADNYIYVLARYIKTSSDNNWGKTVTGSGAKWKTELTVHKDIENGAGTSLAKGFIGAVAKDEKIYFLLVNCTNKQDGDSVSTTSCKFKITVGTVGDTGNVETITWELLKPPSIFNDEKFDSQVKEISFDNNSIFGNAFLTHENKIIFVLKAKAKNSKNITALVRQQTDGKFEVFLVDELSENCHPYIFPWNNSIIKLTQDCKNKKTTDIKELNNMENKWEEIQKPFSRLVSFLVDKQNFVTVKNETTEILLFTEHKTAGEEPNENVYLWMSDGTRFKNIGEIAADGDQVAFINFFFVDSKLFSLTRPQAGSGKEIETVTLKFFEKQSTDIISTINAWSNTDAEISRLCKQKDTFKIPCTANGLVGFLFDTEQTSGESKWKDKYLFKDVTVTSTGSERKTQKVLHGVEFGEDGGVKWEVGSANNDQQYSFTNPGFTLVATVTINDNAGSDAFNSILGVAVKPTAVEQTTNNIGVLCNAENKWVVSDKTKTSLIKDDKGCVVGKTYSIALVLKSEKLEIYVDGEQLTLLGDTTVEIKKTENKIDHFYFGAASEASGTPELKKTAVTITNVLLYNRPLKEEIEQLKPDKKKIDQKEAGSDSTDQQTPRETTDQTGTQPDTSPTKDKEEETQLSSPPPSTEDSAVRVGVVGVLCFMLFGVFTLLRRYVY